MKLRVILRCALWGLFETAVRGGGPGGCGGYVGLEDSDDKIQRRRHPISPRALMAHPGILLKKRHFAWDMVRYGCSA